MSITEILTGLGPILLREFEELGAMILASESPSEAIAKAKRNLEMDGLEAATDLAMEEYLKKLHQSDK